MKRGEQSGDTSGRSFIPRSVRFALLWLLVSTLQGCFLPAPINEESPESDEPPRISSTNPRAGDQYYSYDNTARVFRVSVEEPNTEQTLYWRLIESFGGTANAAVVFVREGASERIIADFEDPTRRELAAVYTTCDHWPIYDLENRNGTLYIAVSDRPFLRPVDWPYKTDEVWAAFLNEEERPVAWVSWPITIEGAPICLDF